MSDPNEKLSRIARGERPRVIDLFAGCGGLSLGFKAAGCDIVAAVEWDRDAAMTHAMNFHSESKEKRDAHALARDITQWDAADLVEDLFPGQAVGDVADIVVGGPPCQSFARVGRAKLREVAEHPEAFRLDARSNLYLRYLHYVEHLQPLAVLMENVPDALNYGGHNIAEETAEALEDLGFDVEYTLLNSVHYGVPQMRERMLLLGIRRGLRHIGFPDPTHAADLPAGYQGSRAVALKHIAAGLFSRTHFVEAPAADRELPPAITVREALADLPVLSEHLKGRMPRGTRRFTILAPYRPGVEPSDYALQMRQWPGYESEHGVMDHVIRSLPRDYAIFERMPHGGQYPEAHQTALALFEEKLAALEREGRRPPVDSDEYQRIRSATVPPYDANKFPNKWRKMAPDQPSRTLMAHLGKDSYSHIHYDSAQARTISVREAARLQSFPDGFLFSGTMNPAFRQIGNAVPPLLARSLATCVVSALTDESERLSDRAAVEALA